MKKGFLCVLLAWVTIGCVSRPVIKEPTPETVSIADTPETTPETVSTADTPETTPETVSITPIYDTSLEEWVDDKIKQGGWIAYPSRSVSQARRDSEWYYQHDQKYKAIMDIAMRLCEEYDYDWGRFISMPEYASFAGDRRVLHYQETRKRANPPKYGICDDYANAFVDEVASLPFVKEVRKWHAPSHAFNELVLDDDRHLWVDVTWMDNDGNYSYGKFDTENITYDLPVFEAEKSISGRLSHKDRDGFTSTYNPMFYKVRWYVFDVNNNQEVTLYQMYTDRNWGRATWFDNRESEYIDFQGYRYEWRAEVTPIK